MEEDVIEAFDGKVIAEIRSHCTLWKDWTVDRLQEEWMTVLLECPLGSPDTQNTLLRLENKINALLQSQQPDLRRTPQSD